MHEPPEDLGPAELAAALREGWGFDAEALRYAPVGFGGHHWIAENRGQRRFVTANRPGTGPSATVDELRAAMAAAASLATDAGLDFVVAPIEGLAGETVRSLGGYALSLFPYLDGEPGSFYDVPSPVVRLRMAELLAALHLATPKARPPLVHDPGLADRPLLDAALAELGAPWRGGPFAEPARELLASHGAAALRDALARFDVLAERVRALPVVITHGEPHQGNVIRDGERLLLVDWDTVRLAPPERDLWWLAEPGALRRYGELTGNAVSSEALDFYRIRWEFDDLAAYIGEFRAPHRRTADTEQSWAGFRHSLARVLGEW